MCRTKERRQQNECLIIQRLFNTMVIILQKWQNVKGNAEKFENKTEFLLFCTMLLQLNVTKYTNNYDFIDKVLQLL